MQAKALSFDNDWQLTMRHASAFNRLYEATVRKEGQFPFQSLPATSTPAAADCPAPALIPKTPSIAESSTPGAHQLRSRAPQVTKAAKQPKLLSVSQLAEIIRQNAEEQHHLQQHPSLKWTWGVDLNESDIRQLFCAADWQYELPHTGYDASLPDGRLCGQFSPYESVPSSFVPSIADDAGVPELSSINVPLHFNTFPLRHAYTESPIGNLLAGGHVSPSSSDLASHFAMHHVSPGNQCILTESHSVSSTMSGIYQAIEIASSSLASATNDIAQALEDASSSASSSASATNALNICQALEDDASSLASSEHSDPTHAGLSDLSLESNPIHDFTMAPSLSSSSSLSNLSPSAIAACKAFNDSDDNSSVSSFATEDEMALFSVATADNLSVLVPEVGVHWIATDFSGLPDPDDCV